MFYSILYFLFAISISYFISKRVRPQPKNILFRFIINIIFIVVNIKIINYSTFYFENIEILEESLISLIPENIKFLEGIFSNPVYSLIVLIPIYPMLIFTQKLWIPGKKGENILIGVIAILMISVRIFL